MVDAVTEWQTLGMLTVPVWVALALAYWPVLAPRVPRVRRIDDPVPCLVLLWQDGTDSFLIPLPGRGKDGDQGMDSGGAWADPSTRGVCGDARVPVSPAPGTVVDRR